MNEGILPPPTGEPLSGKPVDPNAPPAPQMIDSVPGFEMPVAEVAQGMVADAAPATPLVSERWSEEARRIPIENFTGDTTRVLGHPDNQTSKITQAYSDHLRAGENARQVPEDRPRAPGFIDVDDVPAA